MRQRHAAYTTPESIIFALVQRATGQRAVARERVVRGYQNEVYFVTTDRAQEFVVRIRRHSEVSFVQEAWAMDQCRATGVPVPDVLLVDQITEPAWAGEVMVEQKIEGHVLRDRQPEAGGYQHHKDTQIRPVLVEHTNAQLVSGTTGGPARRRSCIDEWLSYNHCGRQLQPVSGDRLASPGLRPSGPRRWRV